MFFLNKTALLSKFVLSLPVLLAIMLTGCGAVGGDDDNNDIKKKTGYLWNSISGIDYKTNTHSGTTNEKGEFCYKTGEIVVFSIGDTVLGETVGGDLVTPFNLIPGAFAPIGNKEINQALWNDKEFSFHACINMAVLFQTLDYDGDVDNGIEIKPEIKALFSGASINFFQNWYFFAYDPLLVNILNEANHNDLFPSKRIICRMQDAMDLLYESLDISPMILAIHSKSYKSSTINESSVYHYDIYGNKILTEYDDGSGNLKKTSCVSNHYDMNENHIKSEYEQNCDGIKTSEYSYQYNDHRYITKTEHDSDGDGLPNSISNVEYDTFGNLIKWEYDSDGNGDTDSIYQYEYNNDRQEILLNYDSNGDTIIDDRTSYEYDIHGNLINVETIDVATEKRISYDQYQYDDNNNKIRVESDFNGNGTWNKICTYKYDANNNCVFEEIRYYLPNSTGAEDSITTKQYDKQGNMVRVEYDFKADGTINNSSNHYYDNMGNSIRDEIDNDGDGIIDEIIKSQYDAYGNIVRYERDKKETEVIDEKGEISYKSGGWNWVWLAYDGSGSESIIIEWD